jgi:hypothetical protein
MLMVSLHVSTLFFVHIQVYRNIILLLSGVINQYEFILCLHYYSRLTVLIYGSDIIKTRH